MAEKMTIGDVLKKNLGIIIASVAILALFFGGGREILLGKKGTTVSDTATTTTQVAQPTIVMVPYQPQQTGNTVYPITIPAQYNPSGDIAKLTEQYVKLYNEFAAIRNYSDSFQLKDTAGNRVGVVNLKQTVSENILKATQPSYQLSFPHTTTTITNTVSPAARNQVFIGIGFESLLNKPNIEKVQAGLLLKNKKDFVIGVAGTYSIPNKGVGIQVSLYKKLSFRLF